MVESDKINPSLLTKSEISWLKGNIEISKSYEYKMKCNIRKKIQIFFELELPLITQKRSLLDLTVYGKYLTANGKVDNPINSSNIEIHAQNMVGRKGLNLFTM